MNKHRNGLSAWLTWAVSVLAALPAIAATHVWTGSWDTPPADGGDIIIRSGTSLVWSASMPSNVNSWVQESTYAATVRIDTAYGASGFTNLSIANDCVVSNGLWMHRDNSTAESWRLKVSVGGNFILGPSAKILADGCGYDQGNPAG